MRYPRFELQEELTVRRLISFMYLEIANAYTSHGEKHDFWEFAYMDKGEAEVWIDEKKYDLRQGDIIFYHPNEFHKLGRVLTPNLFIVSFDCDAPALQQFQGRLFHLNDHEKAILAQMIQEGVHAFQRDPSSVQLNRNPAALFGSEQLVKLHLEMLLIYLIRKVEKPVPNKTEGLTTTLQNRNDRVVSEIISYLQNNLSNPISPEQICTTFSISHSMLKRIFKTTTGLSLNEYITRQRITEAKRLIREDVYNFTQIGSQLGYQSIHHFSRQFKKTTGMTLTEYSRSVHALIKGSPKHK